MPKLSRSVDEVTTPDRLLKGATLFELRYHAVPRATCDVDLLGRGEPAVERMEATFRVAPAVTLEAVVELLGRFLLPPSSSAAFGEPFSQEW